MLEIIRKFCEKEIIKSAPKYLWCAVDSFQSIQKMSLLRSFDFDRTEFTQTFAHFFSTNIAICLLKLFVSFSIATPLALALFDPPTAIYPVAYPVLTAMGYHLSSKVLDDLF